MIEFKNVKLNLKHIDILNNISFKAMKNTVTCIVGNRNAGKSSVLKLIAGIYKDYYGEILIDGKELYENQNIKINMIHDTIENDPNVTVVEYLEFYGKMYGDLTNEEISLYIDNQLKSFALMSYKYTTLDNLDKETYKLIDMIRALMNDPDILLFDNLFFSDNIDYNEKVLNFVKNFVGRKTIIFVARNLNFVEGICDNIGVLDYGQLVAYGKKEEVYKKAELITKVEMRIIGDAASVINILQNDERVINVVYENDNIVFSINPEIEAKYKNELREIEADILKNIISAGIKVSSYRKQQAQFEQLLGRLT